MSVQNGERLATKQDLADMYQEILPYLGGMPEVLANKFSKGDLYSTDEKMIGQWINGKPIYAKTIDFGNLPSGNSSVAHNIADVDNIVSVTGVAISSTNVSLQIPLYRDDANYVGITADRTAVYFWTKGYSNYSAKLTIVYTKTTDSAISIGSDTDYSTEEKIVGTWIDGKPLYQKTFTGGKTAQDGNVYDCRSLNIDTFVSLDGIFAGGFPLNLYYISDGTEFYLNTRYASGYITTKTLSTWQNLDIKVTIQYTKTT